MNFASCNTKTRYDDFTYQPLKITDDCYLRELKESVESGLVPVPELDIFVREGYGALVGRCPTECKNLKELFNYKRTNSGAFFGYERYANEGAELVIGPGCKLYGQNFEKAVYCKNYKEMIEKRNLQSKKSGHTR